MADKEQVQQKLAHAIGERYEVLSWIGGGGMAGVYLARHRIHGGFCAVKVLADHLSQDEAVVEAFLQEARTAANLEANPNIVQIIDIGSTAGLYYLIMQYVEGEDLSTYLKRAGRLSWDEAAYITLKTADALSYAHERGVVHRDLKPANIRLDPAGRVIVMDFGIAKVGSMPSALTQMGARMGTPHYMSPEQIRGGSIDNRSDLYALGAVAYQMVTGRRPFDGETHEAIWNGHLSMAPTPPDQLESTTPAPLSHIILKLLEKAPADRYQTAEHVVRHLKRLGVSEAPATLRPLPKDNLDQWRERSSSTMIPTFGAEAAPGSSSEAPRLEPTGPGDQSAAGSRNKLLALVGGAIIVLLVALGALSYFVFQPSPPPDPDPSPNAIAESIDTPTGEMRLIPAGAFTYGSDGGESPNREQVLHLGDFYIDVAEVSNASFKAFCDAEGREYPESPADDPGYFSDKPDYPVVNVSIADAEAFAAWAGKRLPTQEEWEKAARGPSGSAFPWGDNPPSSQQANIEGAADQYEGLAPSLSFAAGASAYGAVNMAGNVWERTSSGYSPTPAEVDDMRSVADEVDGAWTVVKGGFYLSTQLDIDLRSYMRRGFPSSARSAWIGFRCARDAPAAEGAP